MIWDDDWQLTIEGADGATVFSPSSEIVVLEVGMTEALNYTKTFKTVSTSDDAEAGDQFKIIELDGSVDPVVYTIDPALFTGLTLHIRSKDNTQQTSVAADSGVIELLTGEDVTSVVLQEREWINLLSDGTNLIEVK
jgi:hypothetical protein